MAVLSADISGQRELERALDRMAAGFPRQVTSTQKDVASLVAGAGRPKVPVLTGAARASIVVRASAQQASVVGGSGVPYFAWLAFARHSGMGRVSDDRYIVAGYKDKSREVDETMSDGVISLGRRSGVVVT